MKYNLTEVVRCLYLCRRNHAVILNTSCLNKYMRMKNEEKSDSLSQGVFIQAGGMLS